MDITLIILGVLAVVAVFISEKIIRNKAKGELDNCSTGEVSKQIVHKIAVIIRRNDRLARLGTIALFFIISINSFAIWNNIETKTNNERKAMELESRIMRIEKFLWGDDGGSDGEDPSPNEPGPSLYELLQDIRAQIEAIRSGSNDALNGVNDSLHQMTIKIQELEEFAAPKKAETTRP